MASSWTVKIERGAARQLARLHRNLLHEAAQAIDDLAEDPFPWGYVRMRRYKDAYRIRFAGGYRIVYRVDRRRRIVRVFAVGPRGSVYRGLRNLALEVTA